MEPKTFSSALSDDFDAPRDAADTFEVPKQPEDDHPLNWSWKWKHLILVQLAFHAASAGFTSAILIPAVPQLAVQFGKSETKVTQVISIPLLFLACGPFIWASLANAYGRRPVLLASMLLASMSGLGAGYANSFGTMMTARIFQAIGTSSGFIVGGAVVVDIFWQHERGQKTGIWAQMVTLGPGVGGLVGGPLIQYHGWRWSQWLCAILNAAQFLGYVFTFRETYYPARRHKSEPRPRWSYFSELFTLPRRVIGSSLSFKTILTPLLFLQSPVVVLCAVTYGWAFGEVSVGMANIVPFAFGKFYNFGPVGDGLVFISILVGVLIGEQLAGPLSDYIMKRHVRARKAASRSVQLEQRLRAILPGYIFVPIGLVIFGVTLQERTHWIGPCFGIGIAHAALQIITTVLTTYCIDCYSLHALMVGQFINCIRQLIAFTVPFWNPDLNARVGYGLGFGIEAILATFFFCLSFIVYWKGGVLRERFPVRGLH